MKDEMKEEMRAVIIYESTHHGNTKKLVDAVAERYGIPAVTVEEAAGMDLGQYDRIGIASGVAFGRFYEKTEKLVEERLPEGKEVFFLYTCGNDTGKYANSVQAKARAKNCRVLGVYGCRGFDTFGPFKLVGGIAKGHPTRSEIDGAADFYGGL